MDFEVITRNLTTKQREFLRAKCQGVSDIDAAVVAGVSRRSASRWKKDAEFLQAYEWCINEAPETPPLPAVVESQTIVPNYDKALEEGLIHLGIDSRIAKQAAIAVYEASLKTVAEMRVEKILDPSTPESVREKHMSAVEKATGIQQGTISVDRMLVLNVARTHPDPERGIEGIRRHYAQLGVGIPDLEQDIIHALENELARREAIEGEYTEVNDG